MITAAILAAALRAAADVLDAAPAADKPKAAAVAPKKDAPKKAEPETSEGELDYDNDVRPLVVKLSKDHGREAALEVVGQFETEGGDTCTKAQEVQEGDWPALVKKVKAAQKRLDKAKAEAEADE